MTSLRASLAVLPIRVYQRLISPCVGQRCKYYPSCSEYAAQAISDSAYSEGLSWRLAAAALQPLESRGI